MYSYVRINENDTRLSDLHNNGALFTDDGIHFAVIYIVLVADDYYLEILKATSAILQWK